MAVDMMTRDEIARIITAAMIAAEADASSSAFLLGFMTACAVIAEACGVFNQVRERLKELRDLWVQFTKWSSRVSEGA